MYVFPDDLRKAYEALPIPLVYYDYAGGKVVPLLVTDVFCRQVGLEREQALSMLGASVYDMIHPDDVGRVAQVSEGFIRHENPYNVVFRSRRADGSWHFISGIGSWQDMPGGGEAAVISYLDLTDNLTVITHLKDSYGMFQQDVFYTDPVTGLPNINYLQRFADERAEILRSSGERPELIYADINSMQSYNNQYGFSEGNNLLKLAARVFSEELPGSLVIRGAEDHFIIILSAMERQALTERMEKISQRIRKEAYGNTTGILAGICPYSEGEGTAETLDHARHALKRLGSNLNAVCQFFSSEADDLYWGQRYIVENFEKALENRWIKVYYQGLVRVESAGTVATEALARWVDPYRGIISPGEFIPVLRKYHMMHRLDLYIFEEICRETVIRHDAGLPLLPVSCNFARQDFDHEDIPAALNRIFDKYDMGRLGVERSSVIIEITEQDMATAPENFHKELKQLRESGFRLWLDDFGSGYSSLNVFSRFDVDLIKFDMELIRNLDSHNGANREIMKAMVGVAKKLNIRTLAEGIETEEQRAFLQEIGCEFAQGFLFRRPQPLEAILYRLHNGQKPKVDSAAASAAP